MYGYDDGDEEVKPKGFVNVTFAYSGKEVWEKILAIPFRALKAEGTRKLTVW